MVVEAPDVPSTCICGGSVGAPATEVRKCPDHFRYFRGDQRLIGVSTVLKVWPVDPCNMCGMPMYSDHVPGCFVKAKIENARDRGSVVDSLFSAYVEDKLDRIPRDTRKDAVELFFKLRRWWDGRKHYSPKAQVTLADHELVGVCDLQDGDDISDLKCTYDLQPTHPIQLAAYAELHYATFGRPAKSLSIIHVSERFPAPKVIKVDVAEALQDWMAVRQLWAVVKRRTGKEL